MTTRPETARPERSASPAPRDPVPANDARPEASATLAPPLERILEALAFGEPGRSRAAAIVVQRLGEPRTLELLRAADARAIASLMRSAVVAGDAAALRLGRILVAQQLVAPRRLADALGLQKATGRRIGEELVAAGLIGPREVAEALWLQLKLSATARALAGVNRPPGA